MSLAWTTPAMTGNMEAWGDIVKTIGSRSTTCAGAYRRQKKSDGSPICGQDLAVRRKVVDSKELAGGLNFSALEEAALYALRKRTCKMKSSIRRICSKELPEDIFLISEAIGVSDTAQRKWKCQDKSLKYARPNLGGSAESSYSNRGRTDTNKESRPKAIVKKNT